MKISVVLLSYNQERFIVEALQAALSQVDDNFEVIVADDASTDSTHQRILSYLAQHSAPNVAYFHNPCNLGLVANFWKAIERTNGDVIVAMAGDDISLPNRLGMVRQHFEANPQSMALYASANVIDERGVMTGRKISGWVRDDLCANTLTHMDLKPFVNLLGDRVCMGGAAAYRKDIFTKFPALSGKSMHAEDEICMFRSSLLGSVEFSPDTHLYWRLHGQNQSFGLGPYRGPKQAAMYERQSNTCDQFLADLEFAKNWHDQSFEVAYKRLGAAFVAMKAHWALWAVCHESGVPAIRWMFALRDLAVALRSWTKALRHAVRPTFKMITPYWLQQQIASRHVVAR